jgi:hypothetical protein
MARKAAVQGFVTNIAFEDENLRLTPSSKGMLIVDKEAKTTLVVPARYMIALEKVGKSVKSLYEIANPDEADEADEDLTVQSETSKLEALIAV